MKYVSPKSRNFEPIWSEIRLRWSIDLDHIGLKRLFCVCRLEKTKFLPLMIMKKGKAQISNIYANETNPWSWKG